MFLHRAASFLTGWSSVLSFIFAVVLLLGGYTAWINACRFQGANETFSRAFLHNLAIYLPLFTLMFLLMILMMVWSPHITEFPPVALGEFLEVMGIMGLLMLRLSVYIVPGVILVLFGMYFLLMMLGLVDKDVLRPPWDWRRW